MRFLNYHLGLVLLSREAIGSMKHISPHILTGDDSHVAVGVAHDDIDDLASLLASVTTVRESLKTELEKSMVLYRRASKKAVEKLLGEKSAMIDSWRATQTGGDIEDESAIYAILGEESNPIVQAAAYRIAAPYSVVTLRDELAKTGDVDPIYDGIEEVLVEHDGPLEFGAIDSGIRQLFLAVIRDKEESLIAPELDQRPVDADWNKAFDMVSKYLQIWTARINFEPMERFDALVTSMRSFHFDSADLSKTRDALVEEIENRIKPIYMLERIQREIDEGTAPLPLDSLKAQTESACSGVNKIGSKGLREVYKNHCRTLAKELSEL